MSDEIHISGMYDDMIELLELTHSSFIKKYGKDESRYKITITHD